MPRRQTLPCRSREIGHRIAVALLAIMLAVTTLTPAVAGGPDRGSGRHAEREITTAKKKGGKSKTVRRTFANEGTMLIPAVGPANGVGPAAPYPSAIGVSGFKKARLTDVNLTLHSLSHELPADIAVLLVAPDGRNAVVMGGSGNTSGEDLVRDITLTLDDEAATALPESEPLTSGSFRPLNANGPAFPPPAPPANQNAALSTFDGVNPNGAWQLFIADVGIQDEGFLDDGWSLDITAKSKKTAQGKGKKRR